MSLHLQHTTVSEQRQNLHIDFDDLTRIGILDDGEDEDVLMNVNMADDERYRESVENKKKKPAYNPYDDSEIDEFGMVGLHAVSRVKIQRFCNLLLCFY